MQLKPTLHIIFLIFLSISTFATKYDTDSLQQTLHITELPSERVKILNLLSRSFVEEDLIKAENFAQQALFIAESINNKEGKAEAQYYIAQVLISRQDYSKAFDLLSESLMIFEALNDEKWIAKVGLSLGTEYKRKFEMEHALRLLLQSLAIFKKLDKENMLAATYTTIGGVYFDQGNNEKAMENYQLALTIYLKTNNNSGTSSTYNNIGEIYRLKGQNLEALSYYKKAITHNDDINRKEFLAVVYENLGIVYLNLDKNDSALLYLSESDRFCNQINIPYRKSSIAISLGKYYLKSGNIKESLKYLMAGYEQALLHSNLILIREASYELSKVFALQNNFQKAYFYHHQYKQVSDSIIRFSNLGKIAWIEMKSLFDNEQKTREIEQQKTNLTYVTLAICLFFVLVILILLYGRQRIKMKHSRIKAENLHLEQMQLKDDIDFKNRELTTNVMYLVKKNELLGFITEKLQNSKSKFTPANRKKVEGIIINLQKNVDKDIWKVFEKRFREVHQDFYDKLVEKFPHLTEKDKKLCALIKLNLNTKEISSLTHLNVNSIEVARTRLRKKLNISNTDISLNTFLSGL